MFRRSRPGRGRARRARSASPLSSRFRKPLFELLEDRRLLAVLTVNSALDNTTAGDNLVTLREAIIAANTDAATDGGGTGSGADTIQFAPGLNGATINLSSLGELAITSVLSIDATSLAAGLTIKAFDNSAANGDGTRIFNVDDANAAAINVTLTGLTLTGGDVAGAGGAISSTENLTVVRSIITGNRATLDGGGISHRVGALFIDQSRLSSNTTLEDGGGVYVFGATSAIITDTTVSGNTAGDGSADYGGGVYIQATTTVTIASTTVSGNMSMGRGGGIYFDNNTTSSISNSTISGNSTNGAGGGLWADVQAGQMLTIEHTTITRNTSDNDKTGGSGGGIFFSSGTGNVTLENTIVAHNTDNSGVAPDIDNTTAATHPTLTARFNLIRDRTGSGLAFAFPAPDGNGNLIGQPGTLINAMLGPLANNGGLTRTHALLVGSPAIDAGDPAFSSPPSLDQRGQNRVSGGRIDIGAFEFVEPVPSMRLLPTSDTGMFNDDGVTNKMQPAFGGLGPARSTVYVFVQQADAMGLPVGDPFLIGQSTVGSDGTDGVAGDGLGQWEVTVEPLADGKYFFFARFDDFETGLTDPIGEEAIELELGITPEPIPDGPGGVATVSTTIASSMPIFVSDVNLSVNIEHTFDGDLTLVLVSPSGTRIVLSDRNGGSGNNYQITLFDDAAGASITAGAPPFNGSFQPEEPFSTLFGENALGTWTLEVTDHAGADTGQIISATLSIASPIMVVIDTVEPNTPFLDLIDDTGRHNNDNITKDNTPRVTMTSTDPNAALAQLMFDDNLKFRIYDRFQNQAEFLLYDSALDADVDAVMSAGDMFTALTFITETLPEQFFNMHGGTAGTGVIEVDGAGVLADGVHNLKLEVEDRAGNISHDFILQIVVDASIPPVSFGLPTIGTSNQTDGLAAESDSGTATVPATFADRVTNDTTPKLWGRAEANSIVRVYVDNPNAGAPGLIDLTTDFFIGQAVAVPFDGNDAYPNGYWELTSTLDLNQILGLPRDGLRRLLVTTEDVAGNPMPVFIADFPVLPPSDVLNIFIDTQGPRITGLTPNGSNFNLFDPKPSQNGPTPLVSSLTMAVEDLPLRFNDGATTINDFLYEALVEAIAENPGSFSLVGDHVGPVAIQSIDVSNAPVSAALTAVVSGSQFTAASLIGAAIDPGDFVLFTSGANDDISRQVATFNSATGELTFAAAFPNVPVVGDTIRVAATDAAVRTAATATITLNFFTPLADDRYTLTVSDSLVDPAGNRLDGEVNAPEPQAPPSFPTGNGVSGGHFVARFTVDARPEIGSWVAQDIDIDINGNFVWDPGNGLGDDATNADITWTLPVQNADGTVGLGGFNVHDLLFAGKFGRGQVLVGDDAVFVIDVSGSTTGAFGGDPIGDQNNDGSANTILDAEIAAFKLLNQQLIDRGLGNTALVSIVAFDSVATGLDMDPMAGGIQLTTTPLADSNSNGMRDVEEVLMALTSGGGTDFEVALQQAITTINTAGYTPGNGNVVFLSDGFGSGAFDDEVNTIRNTLNMNLRAFGVGPGASLAQLLTMDPDAETFSNTNELLAAFAGGGAGGGSGAGFDQLAAYGNSAELGVFRWIIDTNSDGVVTLGTDVLTIQPALPNFNIQGAIPVAGNFDGNAANGDEVGLYYSGKWGLDTNRDFIIQANEVISTNLFGKPIVGDFDGDGLDDLAVFNSNQFFFNLANDGLADANDAVLTWGFPGVLDQPVAADMDRDGIDDIGLWVPRTSASPPAPLSEWYFLISNDPLGNLRATGSINRLNHTFTPTPFGKDIYADFGDSRAMPIVGNFDPPVAASLAPTQSTALTGDYNGDNRVDRADYNVWKANYGSRSNLAADGNDDGVVNMADYTMWRDHITFVETPRVGSLAGGFGGGQLAFGGYDETAGLAAQSAAAPFSLGGAGGAAVESETSASAGSGGAVAFLAGSTPGSYDDEPSLSLAAPHESDAPDSSLLLVLAGNSSARLAEAWEEFDSPETVIHDEPFEKSALDVAWQAWDEL